MDWGSGVGNAVMMVAILHGNATDVYAFRDQGRDALAQPPYNA
jgi:hypothetical protein